MRRDFGGEAAGFYHRYRRGYPGAVIDVLADVFGLAGQDVTVDLGCGTGQLTLPIAGRVRAVIGVDVEPDMLAGAQQAARDADASNVLWMLGADADIPALRRLLGDRSVGAVTIALGTTLSNACGTDEESRQRYREDLAAAGFDVFSTAVEYEASLDIDQLVGGVYSAIGSRIPAASQRPAFAEQLRRALAPHDHFSEHVHVAILAGTS